jgi:hypothetical protein
MIGIFEWLRLASYEIIVGSNMMVYWMDNNGMEYSWNAEL